MKKILAILIAIVGFGINVNAQTAGIREVSIHKNSSTMATISVKVMPTFTPTEKATYVFVVSAHGAIATLLDSSTQSSVINYDGYKWSSNSTIVNFVCDIENDDIKQCRAQDFSVTVYKEE
jgi:hypothetical protein